MALASWPPRLPPAVWTMFQSKRSASPGGVSAAIQSRSSARNCAISGPRSSSMEASWVSRLSCSLVVLACRACIALRAPGPDGEVTERDATVGPHALRAEHRHPGVPAGPDQLGTGELGERAVRPRPPVLPGAETAAG